MLPSCAGASDAGDRSQHPLRDDAQIQPTWRNQTGVCSFPRWGCRTGDSQMCDYSLQNVRSRPAAVGDKLITRDFGTGTRGFSAREDADLAVCVLPGTELAFDSEVRLIPAGLFPWRNRVVGVTTAIFRQVNKGRDAAHHDALEFPDGKLVLLTLLREGQLATVLQLPAKPRTVKEVEEQQRVAYLG